MMTDRQRFEMPGLKFRLILQLTVVVFSSSAQLHLTNAETSLEEYYLTCGRTHNLTLTKGMKLSTPFFGKSDYSASIKCNWTAVGSSECKPSISCTTMDLRETVDCTKDYLEIYDGGGGYTRVCGKEKVLNLQSEGNSRYLFVNLVTSSDNNFKRKYAGVACEVACNQGKHVLPVPESPITEDPTCVCGMQEQKKSGRIINGENAKFREFPWLVAVVWKGTRSPLCGGSIINNRWILCASHCFIAEKPIKPNMIEILIGAHIINVTLNPAFKPVDKPLGAEGSIQVPGWKLGPVTDQQEDTLRIGVDRIVIHPLYTPNFDFDISLLELAEDIDFRKRTSANPICLPRVEEMKVTYERGVPVVAGWGLAHEKAGSTTRHLQKIQVPVLNNRECSSMVPFFISERMLCAGYTSGVKDACTGDSGGPLMLKNTTTQQWTQIGIVSWGQGCARPNSPGFYTRVTELVQWIQVNAQDAIWCSRKSKSMF